MLEASYWGSTNTPIFGADGRLSHIVHHAHNVTTERATQHAFAAQEQQFHTLAEAIPQLAWIAEPDGSIVWYNQRWYDYTGATPEQMAGWGWQAVHDPAELPRVLEGWRASIHTGSPFDMEFPLRGADGRFRWFLTRVMPVKDADGRVLRWFGTNTNIDDQRAAARAVEERQERLEAALRASSTGTFRWDIGSATLAWDESLDALFGLRPGAVVRSLEEFIARVHPEDRARVI
ncbi:MAG: PAS domain-containing protein, partial [Gemmatimonadales bacterium]|nr:PAS domain-containing protein [Gemmatimonadales bacterium]